MAIIIVLVVLTLIILYFFSSKASPIPYFPTNSQDMPMIVKAMKLANNQVIIDLGAGDGAVVWAAATSAYEKGLNTQFVAVDINIVLVLWMKFRRLVHPHKAHISIIHGDMFLLNYKKIIGSKKPLFYLYIAPWFTKQVHKMIQELNIPCTILSYFYPITSGKSQKTAHRVHELYFYTIR